MKILKRGHLEVRRSKAGLGLYTKVDIPKGRKIIEYIGKILTDEQADRKGGKYLFEVNKKITIDGTTRKNLARYVNHSCRPNCWAEIIGTRVWIIAKRQIKSGEELNYHYGKWYFEQIIKPGGGCKCLKCAGH